MHHFLFKVFTWYFYFFYLVPEPPVLKHLCTVMIWKPPEVSNGEIQQYELKFINSASKEEPFLYGKTDNFHQTTVVQREENVLVQVSMNYFLRFYPN